MICANCQTTLPDEAVACWKCGSGTRGAAAARDRVAPAGGDTPAPGAVPASSPSSAAQPPPSNSPSSIAPQRSVALSLALASPAIVAPTTAPHTPTAAAPAPEQKGAHDLLLVIITFVGNAAFFICAGWSVPFAIWGNLRNAAKQNPEWTGIVDVVSGVALLVSGLVFFLGCWLGSYWAILRLISPSPVPESR